MGREATSELSAAKQRIADLERKIGQQQVELDFFSASLAASRGRSPVERRAWQKGLYAVMQSMTADLPQGELTIMRMCSLARLSRAGYYRHWQISAPRQEEMGVRDAIQRIALEHRYYGHRRIAAQLRREGFVVSHKRVLRLMREDNLLCLRKRSFVPATTDSRHGWRVVPNLARFMVPTAVDQLWVADITYVRMMEEFAYLAIILDAYSRRVIGWALETHMLASLVIAALKMAITARKPLPGTLVHHSDRGTQYACSDYTDILNRHAILPSMSRVAYPYDNAKAESFMKTLKQEEVNASSYRDVRHARQQIGAFLEEVYNRRRLHSALDYVSPVEFEAQMQRRIPGIIRLAKEGFQGMRKSTAMATTPLLPRRDAKGRCKHSHRPHRSEFSPAIPRRVAPQQSPLPLRRMTNYTSAIKAAANLASGSPVTRFPCLIQGVQSSIMSPVFLSPKFRYAPHPPRIRRLA